MSNNGSGGSSNHNDDDSVDLLDNTLYRIAEEEAREEHASVRGIPTPLYIKILIINEELKTLIDLLKSIDDAFEMVLTGLTRDIESKSNEEIINDFVLKRRHVDLFVKRLTEFLNIHDNTHFKIIDVMLTKAEFDMLLELLRSAYGVFKFLITATKTRGHLEYKQGLCRTFIDKILESLNIPDPSVKTIH